MFQITAVENILRNKWNFSYITFKSSGYSISTMNLKKQQHIVEISDTLG